MSEMASILGRVWMAIDDLDREVPAELAAGADVQSSLILLGLLRNARKQLQTVEGFVEHAAAQLMDGSEFQAPGVHAVRRQMAEKEVWDHEGLATAVLVSAIVDENGELPSEEAQVVASKVKAALVICAGITRWRTRKLEEAKIVVAEYRTRTPGRYTIDVTLGENVESVA